MDRIIGSFHGGELVVIASSPSFGKTFFALSLLKTITTDQKIGIGSRKKQYEWQIG
jgi:replicative DNA helicase